MTFKKSDILSIYRYFLDKNFESEMSLGIPIKVLHEAEGRVLIFLGLKNLRKKNL